MELLRESIVSERPVYLQGENVCFTVTLADPTASEISSVPPFPLRSLSFSYEIQKIGVWGSYSSYISCGVFGGKRHAMDGVKVINIRPFESLSERYCILDDGLSDRFPPGHYRASHVAPDAAYRGSVEFDVVKVETESATARVALPELERERGADSGVEPGCLGMIAVAYRSLATTVIVVAGERNICYPLESGKDLFSTMEGFSRVAEVPEGVTALSLERHGDRTVAVIWKDGKGRVKQLRIPQPTIPQK